MFIEIERWWQQYTIKETKRQFTRFNIKYDALVCVCVYTETPPI